MSDDLLRPKDHAEAVALFRAEVIGAQARRELSRGELSAEIRKLAKLRFQPPGRRASKVYGASTLERWLYAYRRGGLAALRPDARSDRGRGRELTPEQRALLLDIRREHPGASVPLILKTLARDGRLAQGAVSASTVARLYREAKLPRGVRQDGPTRLRWQADHPGALWHGDVCHGPALRIGQTTRPLALRRNRSLYSRIHHRLEVSALTPDDTTDTRREYDEHCELAAARLLASLYDELLGSLDALRRYASARLTTLQHPEQITWPF